MKRDVFSAIADPTRREILKLVAGNTQSIHAIAINFSISRTAVYKHLKILSECGLVALKQTGREMHCEAMLEQLDEVIAWVEQQKQQCKGKMAAL